MNDISSPFVRDDDPDRHTRCQDALQSAFLDLIAKAVAAGWSEREAVAAVADLADHHMLSNVENANTDALISLLKRMT
jgi:hypothetical protein